MQRGSTRLDKSSASGASGFSNSVWPASRSNQGADVQSAFPPGVVVAIKALACELPHQTGLPISRFQIPDIKRAVIERGLVASVGETTLWRWLTQDAIRPWCHRSWIFPRDPQFEQFRGL
ncbi:MAG TPA: hypothetical protein VNM92_08195 [Thermoanaerobaculia bacterium]|nr:hypothetical protein [Thermoanaerobaculia bacterium]